MTIAVVHVKDAPLDAVYIGRKYRDRPASPLANRWKVFKEAERADAIQRYEAWLRTEIADFPSGAAAQEIKRLGALYRAGRHIDLACWCAPKACHGDVVMRFIRREVGP